MDNTKAKKIFGIGPFGAIVSLVILGFFRWIDRALGYPPIMKQHIPLKYTAMLLIILGLGLHFWSMRTLRKWWVKDQLCTLGPFKYFRHPMYSAWITFIISGVALYLNSWILLIGVISLHPIWHLLVTREEKMMLDNFGEHYRKYSSRTGRFFPRIFCK